MAIRKRAEIINLVNVLDVNIRAWHSWHVTDNVAQGVAERFKYNACDHACSERERITSYVECNRREAAARNSASTQCATCERNERSDRRQAELARAAEECAENDVVVLALDVVLLRVQLVTD